MSNIPDDLDKMLQGDDNPNASPAQNGQQGDSIQGNPIEQPTEEEVEFNKLDGKAQDRFKAVWARARQAEEALETERLAKQSYVPPAPGLQPDQKTAIETLSKFGITTDDKMEAKINTAFNQLRWDNEQQRLESKYAGKDSEPQYVREEVEDYIRKHPQFMGYAAEDVFKYKMFPDEFSNVEATRTQPVKRSSTLRPTRANIQSDSINADNVEEMVSSHDEAWYDDHKEEINRAVTEHTKQYNQEGQRV